MGTTRLQAAADRRSRDARRDLAEHLRRMADDAGVGLGDLARVSGVARSYVGRILDGEGNPSQEVYARLGAALGADFSTRYFPTTGPALRDRHQARMMEGLLAERHPRWHPYTEVAVRRPSRGFIDVALHERDERLLVASELQSELRRLEQLIRWTGEKASSLPSWVGWQQLGDEPRIGRLLIVRRTRATRAVATEFAGQLRVAYPAHPDDAVQSLTGSASWPGDALVWMVIEKAATRFVSGR